MNVSHGSFLGLDNLEELYMQSNKIFQIEANTFVSLHSTLAYLDLSFNDIKKIRANTFNSLTSLLKLNLNDNQIDFIDIHAALVLSARLLMRKLFALVHLVKVVIPIKDVVQEMVLF